MLSRNKLLKDEVAKYKGTVLCKSLNEAMDVVKEKIKQIDQVRFNHIIKIAKKFLNNTEYNKLLN